MQYISQEGLEQLKKELEELKGRRQEIAKRLEEAKALGDLSENAEYQEAKEDQAFNEGKIVELAQIINEAVVINKNQKNDIVRVGSTVKVKSDVNGAQTFVIVGSEEANPIEGKVSNESPLGKAFLGRKAGEIAEAETPRGKIKYKILSIE
jgi:transcription elongation factor GreA